MRTFAAEEDGGAAAEARVLSPSNNPRGRLASSSSVTRHSIDSCRMFSPSARRAASRHAS
jgi:hypothetical protein